MNPRDANESSACRHGRSASLADLVRRTHEFALRQPLLAAILLVVPLVLLAIVVFRPSYDTNDDPVMSLIVSGKVVSNQPDEHMVFTHFLIGLVLKQLYLLLPAIPWYGIYLFAVHACAHVATVYVLFKQRLTWPWLSIYFVYAAVVGLLFLNALQFTTTAFLATQSGLLLGLYAFMQAAKGESRSALRCGAAGAAFLLLAALIRWHVFLMFFSLAIPAACMLAWSYRRQTRLLVIAGGLVASMLVVLVGLSWLNDAYYESDPRWSDFYSYNELRARINDLAWVYYSPETAHVFPKVGWTVNDYAMIQSWFYDDPAVYNAAKLQELLDAYPWTETNRGGNGVTDLLGALAGDPHVLPLLALVAFMALMLGHNKEGQTALLLTCLWVVGMLCAITFLRKPPPPRVYLPMLAFPAALALTLGPALRGSAARSAALWWRWKISIPQFAFQKKLSITTRRVIPAACVVLAAFGAMSSLSRQLDRRARVYERSQKLHQELAALASQPDKLFVGWATSIPFEVLNPLDSLQSLSHLHMLQFGWTQQCAFHADMKARFGITDLPRDLLDRPDIVLICDQACLRLMVDYIRQHHGIDPPFAQIAPFANAAMFHVPSAESRVASGERPTKQ
jgi:hypothetical protein